MSKSKKIKKHRLWKPSDLARVAAHLRNAGYEESLIYLAVRSEEEFTIDDRMRELEPQIGLIKRLRDLRRFLKLLAALLAVIVVLTGGAATVFVLPLEAELMAVIIAIGIFARELRRLKKYVREARHFSGSDVEGKPLIDLADLPDEEEIDATIKEADDLAAKVGKLLDGLDVIFD